jgi:hypothetical protein
MSTASPGDLRREKVAARWRKLQAEDLAMSTTTKPRRISGRGAANVIPLPVKTDVRHAKMARLLNEIAEQWEAANALAAAEAAARLPATVLAFAARLEASR